MIIEQDESNKHYDDNIVESPIINSCPIEAIDYCRIEACINVIKELFDIGPDDNFIDDFIGYRLIALQYSQSAQPHTATTDDVIVKKRRNC
jgi:hypothetical protein